MISYIGIGSNVGDSLANCKEAVARLSGIPETVLERVSSFYKTEPVTDLPVAEAVQEVLRNQDWFTNAAVEIRTLLSPRDLLRRLQDMENTMGRVRTFAGAPRVIDLDLLLYGQEVINEKDLVVPHPSMHKRRFVLEPLCEIASYVIHPLFGISMRGLKDRLEDQKKVEIHQ
ncbi:MAG: 2-amino-4-hydroxy-6-hydroxymethyldihydropteridine diphosphokinase [Deltaproteobacteria bacterium HGW-Deltaproteobacteria-1]|nr:MAG: 2-amino-4-hydroxy-6-hydroxymethyldihydropteridine diphosphokinase [Deltaproteobacteria bacterium HGW-Deltaproteobacteria-1]